MGTEKYKNSTRTGTPWETEINLLYIRKYSSRDLQRSLCASSRTISQLMLYKDIIAFYFNNHVDHKYTLCGQNAAFSLLNVEINILTTRLQKINQAKYTTGSTKAGGMSY